MAKEPSLLDQALGRMTRTGPDCGIKTLKRHHPERAAEIDDLVLAAFEKRIFYTVAATILSEALNADIGDDTVSRHARRRCTCPS